MMLMPDRDCAQTSGLRIVTEDEPTGVVLIIGCQTLDHRMPGGGASCRHWLPTPSIHFCCKAGTSMGFIRAGQMLFKEKYISGR